MKPVELEIFLQDGVSPGLKKAGAALDRFSEDLKRQLKDTSGAIAVQRRVIAGLTEDIRSLEKAYKSAVPGADKTKTGVRLDEMRRELETEKAGLAELMRQQEELKLKQDDRGASLRTQLRNVREEIATLLLAYRSLTDAEKNTAQGRGLARHIDELTEKAGELNDAIMDTSKAVANAASDTRGFDQMAGGMRLVVDGFGLATAGAQALGLSGEDLIEVQTRLQTALVASNALTSMQTNLQRQSAVMQGVASIQTKAAATAENIRTWAVGRGVAATKAATVAQAAFNAVAKANPYVVLAAAVVTVVGALWAFSKGSKEARKAEEERQAQIERARQTEEEYRKAVVEGAGVQIASYLRLKKTWEDLGGSLDQRKKFITDTKDEWHKLGKEIGSVNDMERMFREGTGDMINAILLRAEVKAYESRIQAAADEMVDEIEKNKTYTYTPAKQGTAISGWYGGYGPAQGGSWTSSDFTSAELEAVKGHTYYEGASIGAGGTTYLDAEGARIITQMRKDAGKAAALANQQAARDNAQNRINGYIDTISKLNDRLDKEMAKLPGVTVEPEDTKKNNPLTDPRVVHESKVNEELQRLRWQNEQNDINMLEEGAERTRRQIQLDWEKRMAEIEKQHKSFAEKNKEDGVSGLNANGLTQEQQDEIDRANNAANQARNRSLAEMYRNETQQMREYLKEYGSFQQQKLAIAEEYDEKIRKAQTEGERLALEKEKSKTLSGLTYENISMGIDWSALLGDIGHLSQAMLQPMLDQLEAFQDTAEYNAADLQDKEKIDELIREMRQYVGSDQSMDWTALADAVKAFNEGVAKYKELEQKEAAAVTARNNAKKQLDTGEITKEEFDVLDKAALELGRQTADVREEMRNLGHTLNTTSEKVAGYVSPLTAALSNAGAWKGLSGFSELQTGVGQIDALKGALDSSLATMGDGLGKTIGSSLSSTLGSTLGSIGGGISSMLSSGLGNVIGIVAQIPHLILNIVGGIKNLVVGFFDALKEIVSLRWIDDLIVGILDAIGSLVDTIFDLPENLYHVIEAIIVNGIGGLLNTIIGRIGNILSFGLLSSKGPADWFTNSNAREVQETMDRLTERNGHLQTAIEDLTDEIKASRGTKSVAAYRDAYRYQQETNANYLGMAQAQAGYHGSHHSWDYYWGGFSQDQIARLSKQIGRPWDGSLWSLSPEEMRMLRSNVDMWQRILDTGKGGYGGRLGERLDDYIAQAGKLEELTTQLYEGLTCMSFDSMYDSFIDRLMDMEASTEDFVDDISGYFMRAMLSNKIGEMYADRLEEWWEKFGRDMEDNDLSEAERHALSEEYMDMVEEAMRLRDRLAAATGYDLRQGGSGQSGKAGALTAMTYDQGTKLEGLFVSAQGHLVSIDDFLTEDVAGKLGRAEALLQKIADNTGMSAGILEKIKTMVEKIIRDGIRTR